MSTEPGSLEKAIRAELEPVTVIGSVDPVQLDMLRGADGKLPANTFQRVRQGAAQRGRPPGALNKRNKTLAKLVTQECGDPVLFMGRIYAMDIDQLVELLKIADNSAQREAELMAFVDKAMDFVATLSAGTNREQKRIDKLENMIDRLSDLAKELKSKPGELAVKALAIQLAAAAQTAPYVHGKQPVSVEVTSKADLVIFAPEIMRAAGVANPEAIMAAVGERGLEAFDPESMQVIPEADYDDVATDGEGDAE